MSALEFIATYTTAIVRACKDTGIFPSVKMAQMALESGWGRSFIANNAFGIKAAGAYSPYWKGAAINANTMEYINGGYVSGPSMFRAYNSVEDSIKDHTYFLQQNQRYTTYGVFAATTPEQQARALKAAGYATDPLYADKLIKIINDYNLKAIDNIAQTASSSILPVVAMGAVAFIIYRLIRDNQ